MEKVNRVGKILFYYFIFVFYYKLKRGADLPIMLKVLSKFAYPVDYTIRVCFYLCDSLK